MSIHVKDCKECIYYDCDNCRIRKANMCFDYDKFYSETRYIAFSQLYNKCGKILGDGVLYPKDIFNIAYDFIHHGCKSRSDYEYLVTFLFEDNEYRKELLK